MVCRTSASLESLDESDERADDPVLSAKYLAGDPKPGVVPQHARNLGFHRAVDLHSLDTQ